MSRAKDQGRACGLYQSDLSSAFDVITADILLPKMRLLGVSNSALKMVETYLTNRRIRVKVENTLGPEKTLSHGSGQGTQISPSIWLIYIIDVPIVLERATERIRGDMLIFPSDKDDFELSDATFADDVNTVVTADTNEEVLLHMKIVKEEFGKYFSANGLCLQGSKLI